MAKKPNPSITSGNIASPEITSQTASEWTTEDFLAAEPYPVPEVTDEMVQEFIEKTASPSTKGGEYVAGRSAKRWRW